MFNKITSEIFFATDGNFFRKKLSSDKKNEHFPFATKYTT